MVEVLVKAGCFVSIILLGYVLKRVGFFKEEDFTVLSKIVLKITLPAAIISSFAGKEITVGLLAIALIPIGAGLLYMLIGYVMGRKGGKEQQSFEVLNTAGYNIGNFTLPFVQSFLGPVGVVATSLFDTGNAVICLGGAYSVASMIKGSDKFSIVRILRTLTKSVAFDCYIIVVTMSLLHIPMPTPVISLAEIIGNANAFLAMFMLGVGFKLSGDKKQMGIIARILAFRYGVAIVLAVLCFLYLPLPLEMRQAITLLLFSPIGSAAPAFTADMKGDVGLASALNSISILCSIVLLVITLLLIL